MTDQGRRRVLLATFGTLGDLFPTLAMAAGLRDRGHRVVVATSAFHRAQVEQLGIEFAAVRPDLPDWQRDPSIVARMMDRRHGTERVIREYVVPSLRAAFDDLSAAADGADLLVSSLLAFAAPLVAERRGIPWASMSFQPSTFFSVFDPPTVGFVPGQGLLRAAGPWASRLLLAALRSITGRWLAPLQAFRAEVGLAPSPRNPFFEGQHSPLLALALFSPLLARPQADWPPSTVVTGFPFDERIAWSGMPPELDAFLRQGPPPVAFTLGSSAVLHAGSFYRRSCEALVALGRRGVLLVGPDPRNRLRDLPDGVMAVEYAPHAELFPRCEAVVHQGGIGTLGQAMRAGRPMLVVPFAHDQPDNADRAKRLGVARVLHRQRYRTERVAAELRALLDDGYRCRAEEVGRAVSREHGVAVACDAIEAVLDGR